MTSYLLSHPDKKPFLVMILQDDDETLDMIQYFLEYCLATGWSVDSVPS
jgi:hypothetical protein